MKTIRAYLLVIIGLIMLIAGIGGFIESTNREDTVGHKIGKTIDRDYREEHNHQKMLFIALIVGGALSIIYGISVKRSAEREKIQRQHNNELREIAKANKPATDTPKPPPLVKKNNEDDKLDKLKKLGELRDSGVLTQEEFEKEKAKLL